MFGTGVTIRREVMHAIADTKAVANHYLLETANMADRVLRATGTNARKHLCKFL